jgi:hypothetical protein
MPMGLISTRLISYQDIRVNDTDLIEDAWGINAGYSDVINLLHNLVPEPEHDLAGRLMDRIRKDF